MDHFLDQPRLLDIRDRVSQSTPVSASSPTTAPRLLDIRDRVSQHGGHTRLAIS